MVTLHILSVIHANVAWKLNVRDWYELLPILASTHAFLAFLWLQEN